MDPEDTSIYAPKIIEKYENCPDDLDDMCVADFTGIYIYGKADINYEPDDRSYIKLVADI